MTAWIWWAWLQIWPNMAADVLWIPIVGIYHVIVRRALRSEIDKLREELRYLAGDDK